MIEFPSAAADRAVLAALDEDAAACDLATQWSVPDGLVSEATFISRAHGIIAGLQLVDLVMHHIDPSVSAKPYPPFDFGALQFGEDRVVQHRQRATRMVVSQVEPVTEPCRRLQADNGDVPYRG